MRYRTGRYEIKTKQLNGPADPELWYWHLYRDGEKINGGIANSEEEAYFFAGGNRRKDTGEWAGGLRGERV